MAPLFTWVAVGALAAVVPLPGSSRGTPRSIHPVPRRPTTAGSTRSSRATGMPRSKPSPIPSRKTATTSTPTSISEISSAIEGRRRARSTPLLEADGAPDPNGEVRIARSASRSCSTGSPWAGRRRRSSRRSRCATWTGRTAPAFRSSCRPTRRGASGTGPTTCVWRWRSRGGSARAPPSRDTAPRSGRSISGTSGWTRRHGTSRRRSSRSATIRARCSGWATSITRRTTPSGRCGCGKGSPPRTPSTRTSCSSGSRSLLLRARPLRGELAPLYEAMLERNPQDARILLALARMHMKRGDLAEATHAAREALTVDPRSLEARLLVIEIHRRLGDSARALSESTRSCASWGGATPPVCPRCGARADEYWSRCPACLAWMEPA